MATKRRIPLPDLPPHRTRCMSSISIQPTSKNEVQSFPQKRKRGRSKAITSCERCRQAHIKCVSQGQGEPCVNCAKRSTRVCSFMQHLPGKSDLNSPMDQKSHSAQHPEDHQLQTLAASALAYMEKGLLHSSVDAAISLSVAQPSGAFYSVHTGA
ncbi:uncharacterized protein F4812DRAFT_467160 [Daldinia caldariorum]|uniref:uncharacterized protein n=1 Tax=Daldinia caldariorum TaxID=326644 RepID=UPI002008ABA1|nr:uncharacterized protein F4812DRAFT_467160 [Daldinia caldariorum]KAI1464571.1 hypothetical protein F4812DRAFT_467160 [Daldinia caldariorum]